MSSVISAKPESSSPVSARMTGSVRSAGAVAWPSFHRAALFALRACAKGSLLLASPANMAADDTALLAIGRGATLGGYLLRLVKDGRASCRARVWQYV